MIDNHMTIMIVPQRIGRVIRFKLPVFAFKLFLLAFGIALAGSSVLLADYLLLRKADGEQRKIQKAKMLQKLKFRQLGNILEAGHKELEELEEFETKLRLITGLKEVSSNIRFVGAGTNGLPALGNGHSNRASLLEKLDAFSLELKQREIGFFHLEAYLQEQKDRLARTPSIRPMSGHISSRFGIRVDPLTGKRRQHNGLDITSHMYSPIYSPADGVVVATMKDRDFGRLLVIDHGYDVVTRYGHLSKFEVKVGQYVKRGDLICRMGRAGRSSGPHLHYEVLKNDRYVDPMRYVLD